MDQLISYLGDPHLKTAFLEQIAIHEEQDQLVKGTYGVMAGKFKACAIGCSLRSLNIIQGKDDLNSHAGDHDRYPTELGLPLWLAYLEDHLFETLSEEEAQRWPREFAEAIPVGITIPDRTLAKILRWTLAAETFGVRHATDDVEVIGVVDRMAALFDRELAGDSPTDAWAAEAARDAWAAWAARDARAESLNNGAKAAAFSTALSRYVIDELRSLAPIEGAA